MNFDVPLVGRTTEPDSETYLHRIGRTGKQTVKLCLLYLISLLLSSVPMTDCYSWRNMRIVCDVYRERERWMQQYLITIIISLPACHPIPSHKPEPLFSCWHLMRCISLVTHTKHDSAVVNSGRFGRRGLAINLIDDNESFQSLMVRCTGRIMISLAPTTITTPFCMLTACSGVI